MRHFVESNVKRKLAIHKQEIDAMYVMLLVSVFHKICL